MTNVAEDENSKNFARRAGIGEAWDGGSGEGREPELGRLGAATGGREG